jgi:hypothetical protein
VKKYELIKGIERWKLSPLLIILRYKKKEKREEKRDEKVSFLEKYRNKEGGSSKMLLP